MAEPGTAAKFIAALKARGVKVVEHEGWRTHNRAGHGAWGPLHGVMMHHTAGLNGMVEYVYNGSAELPGPLCHGLIAKDGTVTLIGWGRTNHAGGGDPDVLKAVEREDAKLPKTNEHQGSAGAVDGNPHFIGFECVNKGDGIDPWPAVQIKAMKAAAAAVCDLYGWSAKSVIRHLDWSDYKSDPKGIDWPKFQADVQKLLDGDVKPPTTPTGPPVPSTPAPLPVVSLKHVVAAAHRDPDLRQGGTTYRKEVELVEDALVKLHYLDREWADGSYGTKTYDAVKKVQRHLGYTGPVAVDGIVGKHSLTWLGLRSGLFRYGA